MLESILKLQSISVDRRYFLVVLALVILMCLVVNLLTNNILEGNWKPLVLLRNVSIQVQNQSQIPEDGNVADILFEAVKILCLISTSKNEIENRAIHVNATWAKRCNKHVFLSYHENFNLPYLDLGIEEMRVNLWNKTRAMLQWTLKNEIDNYDFFLKADDDSYFIMENLRFMLLPYNPDEALYFGTRFRAVVRSGYMSGGAGYILSREAVKQIVPAFNDPNICDPIGQEFEDVKIGECADKLKFTFVDTRDHKGRHRMLPYPPADHFVNGLQPLQLDYLYYPYPKNDTLECCSEFMISFHYVTSEQMHTFDFMLYHATVIRSIDAVWNNGTSHQSSNISMIEMLRKASRDFSYH